MLDAFPLQTHLLHTKVVPCLNLEGKDFSGKKDLIVLEFVKADGRGLILLDL